MEFIIAAHLANLINIILPHERIRAVAGELQAIAKKVEALGIAVEVF